MPKNVMYCTVRTILGKSNTSPVLIKSWPRIHAGAEEGGHPKNELGERVVTWKGFTGCS